MPNCELGPTTIRRGIGLTVRLSLRAVNEESTAAIGDAQARLLLDAPPTDTTKGLRD